MAGHLPRLDRNALKLLRETVRRLHKTPQHSLPIPELLDLAAVAPAGSGVTIDLEASRELGDAPIVLRVPTSRDDHVSDPRLALLSPREREVAELVAQGLSNKRIADRLCIATSTVKDHVHHILQKTALPNRAAIAAVCRAPVGTP